MRYLTLYLFVIMGRLPLPLLHLIGDLLGDILYITSRRIRERTTTNFKYTEIISDSRKIKSFARKITRETVKTSLELSIATTRKPEDIAKMFVAVEGGRHLEQAILLNKSILLLSPHLGSFDLAGRYLTTLLPQDLTVIYKPAKQLWLNEIIKKGRQRAGAIMAEANQNGVRQIYKSLKRKEAVLLLPDQVPEAGEGIMAKFFNQPAYTMTLAEKLANKLDVVTLYCVGERLAKGKGFKIHFYPKSEAMGTLRENTQQMNAQIESLVRQFPSQYLFSYNRYKIPAGCENK